MPTKSSSDNMRLWNAVCVTDPSMTKKVSGRGGFTAICAQYQRRLATEQWGPYGGKWGVEDMAFEFEREAGDIVLTAAFYYPDGKFVLATEMKYRMGDDCRKKLLTDLTTKALSMLGFNSDVFEGKFDDNKYVAALKAGNVPNGNGKPPNGVSTAEKVALLNDVIIPARRGIVSERSHGDLVKLILKDMFGKETLDTPAELAAVRKAIAGDIYDLATGMKQRNTDAEL